MQVCMLRPARLRVFRACITLALIGLGGAPSPALAASDPQVLAHLEMLPESNPYRSALLQLGKLPEADHAAIREWASSDNDPAATQLTAAQRRLVGELRNSLIDARGTPPLDSSAWPLMPNPETPDDPTAMTLPALGHIRELAKIALKSAEALPADQAISTYAATAQLARQQRAGLTLIEQLSGVAIEGVATAAAAKRLAEYSPEGLQHLGVTWSGLHPLPTNAEAFAGERDAYFRPMLDHLIAPGLHALLADPEAGRLQDTEDNDAGSASADDPFRNLRLSGIVRVGPGEEQVSLENSTTGESFTIRLGRETNGFELLAIDFENHRARLRHGEDEALVDLRSKQVLNMERSAHRLRETFRGFNLFSDNPKGDAALAEMLARARAHPDGVEGYTRELMLGYQAGLDAHLARADSPKVIADNQPASSDPFLALSLPMLGKMGRTLNNAATYPTMLQAAVHHRLAELGQAPATAAPTDPWAEDGAAFGLERTDDGGFILSSRYEVYSGAPLRVKFAAPDAGFVRPTSN